MTSQSEAALGGAARRGGDWQNGTPIRRFARNTAIPLNPPDSRIKPFWAHSLESRTNKIICKSMKNGKNDHLTRG